MKSFVRDNEINLVATLVLLFFLINVYFYYVHGFFYNLSFPNNTFLPNGVTRFCDFYGLHDQWRRTAFAGVGYGLSYFPATYLLVEVLTYTAHPGYAVAIMEFLFLTFFLFYTYYNVKTDSLIDSLRNVGLLTFTSYPVLFIWHTGNLEALVFMFLVLFVFFYKNGKTAISVIPLGMAIAMKLFPLVFVVLYIKDKKYRDIFRLLLIICLLSLLPLLLFKGGLFNDPLGYFKNFHASQKMYAQLMIFGGSGMHFGHSLLNGIEAAFGGRIFSIMEILIKPYLVVALCAFLLTAIYIIKYKPVFWKIITLLVITMCLLPYTSTDYKLIYFFIPLYLFINREDKLHTRESLMFLVLFVLLIVPKAFCYFHGDDYATLNIVLNPIVMIILFASVIYSHGFKLRN